MYQWIPDALRETWSTIARTLRDRDERAFDALTPCPGWTVRDVLSHLIGVELYARGEPVPEVTGEAPAYVRNATGQVNEGFVAARRHLRGADVLHEFITVTSSSLQRLERLTLGEWEYVDWSPEGERSVASAYERRIVDGWIHLQDIRDALLEPADDHGLGEEVTLNRFEASMGYVWAKRAAAPEGALLQLNIMGRTARTVRLRVVDSRGVPAEASADTPTLELTTAAPLFWRRCAGRINAEAFLRASATDVRGDTRLAQRLSDAMVMLP